jgi:hypothetical protein
MVSMTKGGLPRMGERCGYIIIPIAAAFNRSNLAFTHRGKSRSSWDGHDPQSTWRA